MKSNKFAAEFKHEEQHFKLLKPSSAVIREAKFIHSKTFTQSIKDGLFTRRKMESVLKTGDINVVDEYNARRNELLRLYTETRDIAEQNNNPDELISLVGLMAIYRDRLIQEDLSMNSILGNTADQVAEDDRINYLTSQLIVDAEGKKVWNTLDDFLQDTRYEFVEQCKYHVFCWSYSVDPENNNANEVEQTLLKKAQDIRTESKELKTKAAKAVQKGNKDKVSRKKSKSKITKAETLVSSTT